MSKFKFNALKIANVEDTLGKGLYQIIADGVSVKASIAFIREGLDLPQDEAGKHVDEFVTGGGELAVLFMEILEGLQDSGFLSKKVNMSATKEKLNDQLDSLESNGEKVKKQQ